MRKLSWPCLPGLMILLVLSACGRSAAPAPTPAPGSVPTAAASPERSATPLGPALTPEAVTTVPTAIPVQTRAFAGVPVQAVDQKDTRTTGFGEVQNYQGTLQNGDKVQIAVDPQTGDVRGFYRLGQKAEAAKIDLEAAKATALAFAKENYPDFEAAYLTQVQAELIDDGDSSPKYYSFHWVQIDPNSKAMLPNEVRIRVNAATGQVDSYSALRVEVTVATQPKIDENAARQLALGTLKNTEGVLVLSSTLFVSTLPVGKPNGKQALLWAVTLQGKESAAGFAPGATVFIDAQTGEIVGVSPRA